MIKLSETIPISVLLHAPYSLSRLDGRNLKDTDVIKMPCIRDYYQQLKDLVLSGEITQIVDSYYLVPSQQSPRQAKLPSLKIFHDVTSAQLEAKHVPSHPINTWL